MEAMYRLQDAGTEPTKMKCDEILNIVRSKVKLGRAVAKREINPQLLPAPGKGWQTKSKNAERTKHHFGTARHWLERRGHTTVDK